jgi:hypothetical protein
VRANLTAIEQTETVRRVRSNIYELTEFLHDVLKVQALPWIRFPHKVGIHYNCNSLRGIGLASPSELRGPHFSKPKDLLSLVADIQFVVPSRPDECCGFGGTFCVFDPAVSDTLANLDHYLLQFEAAAKANGVQVHWAIGAAEPGARLANQAAAMPSRAWSRSFRIAQACSSCSFRCWGDAMNSAAAASWLTRWPLLVTAPRGCGSRGTWCFGVSPLTSRLH